VFEHLGERFHGELHHADAERRRHAANTVTVPAVHIRPYRPSDRNACLALWVELTERHRDLYDDRSVGSADPEGTLDEYLRTSRAWVAERDGKVVGLAGAIGLGSKAELEPVVVTANARGQGIGRRLVRAAVSDALAHGAAHVFARPVARNLDAIRFFHACGLDVLTRVELATGLRAGEPRAASDQRLADRLFRD
jgi:N-acetylglutamate synthase-like GNAT family acetyltransferase